MNVAISPLEAPFGAVLHIADVDALTDEEGRWLRRVLADQAVLVVRAGDLTSQEHVRLSRVFGEPDIHPIENLRVDGVPELIELADPEASSTDDPDALIGSLPWHTDLSYTDTLSRASLLYGIEVPPEGGSTGFVDLALVYSALPVELRERVDQLKAVHSWRHSVEMRAKERGLPAETPSQVFEDVVHPMVHRHPVSLVPVLNISPMFTRAIVGLPGEEGQRLLAQLSDFATGGEFSYFHQWSMGDLLIWDNWRTMHTVTGHPRRYHRRMRRTTIRGARDLVGIGADMES